MRKGRRPRALRPTHALAELVACVLHALDAGCEGITGNRLGVARQSLVSSCRG